MLPLRSRAWLVATATAAALAAGCGPSVDPAAKADIDKRVGLLTSPSQTFPAPAAPTPMPLAVGQWVQYKGSDDKGQPSFLTIKVVDELKSLGLAQPTTLGLVAFGTTGGTASEIP